MFNNAKVCLQQFATEMSRETKSNAWRALLAINSDA